MFDFSTLNEVKLAHGKHDYPEDGMCFMEMAAWFAGEKHSDKPQCACPVLGTYGMGINDSMPDDLRDALLKPLVPMIAGTRDKASEIKRSEFLTLWATNKIVPLALRAAGLESHAVACEKARTIGEARTAADDADNTTDQIATSAAAAAGNANDVWPIAVEGLRQAILIGRHDGFTDAEPVVEARRVKLIELMEPPQ